jgi:hypothetical protein
MRNWSAEFKPAPTATAFFVRCKVILPLHAIILKISSPCENAMVGRESRTTRTAARDLYVRVIMTTPK